MMRLTKANQMKNTIELYELNKSGKMHLNGGYVKAKIDNILTRKNHYKVYAEIELGDYFDPDHPSKEHYSNCWYLLDKIDFHVLSFKEAEERGIDVEAEDGQMSWRDFNELRSGK